MTIHTLRGVLDAAESALKPTARFSDPLVRINRNELRAFNGSLTTTVVLLPVGEVSHLDREIVISGARLSKVWTEGCRLSVTDQFMTVTKGKSRYRLPLLDADEFAAPTEFPLTEAVHLVHPKHIAAIGLAAHFASENATHPWACGVVLHNGYAIATNNKIVTSVQVDLPLEGTIPFWALAPLARISVSKLHMDERFIGIVSDNLQVVTFASVLAEKPPLEVIDRTLESIPQSHTLNKIPAGALLLAMENIRALGGNRVEFSGATMSVRQDDGSEATCDIEGADFPETVLGTDVAQLLLNDADWVSFDQAPNRIIFGQDAQDSGLAMLGVAMGMRT